MVSTRSQTAAGVPSVSGNPFSIRKFDGSNFVVWKAQVEAYMRVKECWQALSLPRPTGDKPEKIQAQSNWDEQDQIARAILLLSLSDEQAMMVCHLTTASQIWKRLVDAHEQHSQASRVVLQRQFFEVCMKDKEKVIEYVSRVQSIYNQLVQAGVMMNEETLVGRIVSGLTPEFHGFMTNWANNVATSQILSELLPRLTAEESLISTIRKMENLALVVENKRQLFRKPRKNTNKKDKVNPNKNNSESTSKNKPTGKGDYKRRIKCYGCGQLGHIHAQCKRNPKDDKDKPPSEEVAVAEGLVAETFVAVSSSEWILDSGASDHMTFDGSNFVSFQPFDVPRIVKLGDVGEIESLGVGELLMASKLNGREKLFKMSKVLLVPKLRRKLISIGSATSKNYEGEFIKDKFILRNSQGEPLLTGRRQGNLYLASVRECKKTNASAALNVQSCNMEVESNLKLWHERLGHVSRSTIVQMKKVGAVEGLEQCSFPSDAKASDRKVINCESCCQAKLARQPIPLSHSDRASRVGQVMHADICGPIGTATLSGAKYILLVKDEFSNYRFIYLMKSRDEAYECLRKVVIQLKADTGRDLLCLVTDCGSEFTSNRTQTFLLNNKTLHRTSAPFTPQQNGFVERDNRTLMEAVRAMLYHRRMPEKLWGEAAVTAVYTLNRVMNSNTKPKTPYELYFGRKPRISHMRVFGARCFMKLQEKKRSGYQKKLEPRSTAMVMVGYDRDFTYRLFEPQSGKVFLSREVVFDESESQNSSMETCEYKELESVMSELTDDQDETTEMSVSGEANLADQINDEPASYAEALSSSDSDKWMSAMRDEYDSLIKNNTWRVEKLPVGRTPIKSKWVFKLKRDVAGSIMRYKARLCAKGYSQKYGIDYKETFSPVVRSDSIRFILSVVAKLNLDMIHFDVKTAFLHGVLDEDIWMEEPEGFKTKIGYACKLIKSIYGLKQASRKWNECFIEFLRDFNLVPLVSDSCVLISNMPSKLLIVAIYVDDGLACSSSMNLLDELTDYLKNRFEITLMQAECFVGLQIKRDRRERTLHVSQSGFIDRMISKFELTEAKAVSIPMQPTLKLVASGVADGEKSKVVQVPYREAIGALMYIMVGCRPDIACAVTILSRFCSEPKLPHWLAVKNVMKYLKATRELGLVYDGKRTSELTAFSDADYASCRDSRKSLSGVLVKHCGAPVLWKATKQSTVAESTTEAEFIAASTASREIVWARKFLTEVGELENNEATKLMVDNQSAIRLIKNNQVHSKIKHLDIRLMAIRERVEERQVNVEYISTDNQQADILTKPLAPKQFKQLRNIMGMGFMIILALTVVSGSEGARIHWKTNSSPEQKMRRLLLKVHTPCPHVMLTEEYLRGEITATAEGKINATVMELSKQICVQVFSHRVLTALDDLNGCLISKRPKRDLSAVLGATSMIASFIVGVTNFIRGAFEETVTTDSFHLSRRVNESSRVYLTDREVMRDEMERELGIVSETAKLHIEQVREETRQIPMLMWTTYHVMNELYAGAANLRAIKRHCSSGRLATMELAEMLEYPELALIESEETSLESLQVNTREGEVEFYYKVNEPIEITLETLGVGFVIILGILVTTILLALNFEITRALRRKRPRNMLPTIASNRIRAEL